MLEIVAGLFDLTAFSVITAVVHLAVVVGFLLVERRQPAATLAWVVVLIFVPWFGAPAYLIFGPPRRFRRARHHRRLAREPLRIFEDAAIDLRADSAPGDVHPYALSVMRLARRLSDSAVTTGNHVDQLVDARDTYDALLAAIGAAEHHVHVLYYIFRDDASGARFAAALAERQRAGVQVRVLLDAVGSAHLHRIKWRWTRPWRLRRRRSHLFGELLDAGGQVHFFGKPRPWSRLFRDKRVAAERVDFRNHRKLVVIDGAQGFFGGINVGEEYLGHDPDHGAWRDTHARLTGPEVLNLQATFAGDWWVATGHTLLGEDYFPQPVRAPGCPVQVLASGPDQRWSPVLHVFFQAIALAEQRVWLTSPYFIPDAVIQQSLQAAALRGVDVRLLLPSRSDSRIVRWASQSYYTDLLAAGVRIHEYTAGFLHAKTMVVDDWLASIGSANLDQRSFHLNYELGALVYEPAFCAALATQFERDLGRSKRVLPHQLRRLGAPQRLIRGVSRLLSPLL